MSQPPPWPPDWLIRLLTLASLVAVVVLGSGIVALVVHVVEVVAR